MSGRPLKSIMQGVAHLPQPRPKLIARSTAKFRSLSNEVIICLHRTNIITFTGQGIVLNSGGWQTVTTKERMTRFLKGLHIWAEKGEWIVGGHGAFIYEFYDGMLIDGVSLTPLNCAPIPPKPPKPSKPPRNMPSDASNWLRILKQAGAPPDEMP